jgi:hypothetical protein
VALLKLKAESSLGLYTCDDSEVEKIPCAPIPLEPSVMELGGSFFRESGANRVLTHAPPEAGAEPLFKGLRRPHLDSRRHCLPSLHDPFPYV